MTPTYSLLDVMFASHVEPMPFAQRDYQLLAMYNGLAAVECGANPTKDDWRVLVDAVNMTETLVEKFKVAHDSDDLLLDAVMALAAAGKRAHRGLPIRLDARGIQAVRAVLTDYRALLEVLPHRTMIKCHRATEKRIREIQRGKPAPHDVEVTSL